MVLMYEVRAYWLTKGVLCKIVALFRQAQAITMAVMMTVKEATTGTTKYVL